MKLLYDLRSEQLDILQPETGEDIWYCVPVDLTYDYKEQRSGDHFAKKEQYLVVTETRILVLDGVEILYEEQLKNCSEIKCEHRHPKQFPRDERQLLDRRNKHPRRKRLR